MEKYYLGLDIGTGSVGWAVTDKNYNLLKEKVKHYGDFICLKQLILLKKEECFVLHEEDCKEKAKNFVIARIV